MLTDHDMTEKLLKQLITEKKQELEKITKNDPRIIEIINDINDFKQTLSKYNEDPLTVLLYRKIINMKQEELSRITNSHREITKLKMDICALETTLQTITKNKNQPEEIITTKQTLLLPKPTTIEPKTKPHPLDRATVNKKIELFNNQTKNFKITKEYKNNQLVLLDHKERMVNFSLFVKNDYESQIKHIDSWLDKTLKYSAYYNKLTKIFEKLNTEYNIITTFTEQGDKIYIKYCNNSKTPNTTSILHIKKKGKSFIETTKEINCKKDYFEIPLKNNTTVQVSGYNNTDYDDFNLTVELKHIERHVKQNDLEKHFENIFNALKKQSHLGFRGI